MGLPHFIASDVHLGAVPAETEREFVRFLEHVGEHGRALLLVGDLFDFWFEYGTIIPGKHFRVLAALASLVDAGLTVQLIGGNHDAWGGRFLREEVGVGFTSGQLRTEIAGRPALVAHGDGVGGGDLGYRMLKVVLRSRVSVAAFRVLHPELGLRLAGAVSRTEHRGEGEAAARGRARHLEQWGLGELRADPTLAWVVCGHAHLPGLREFEPGRYYVNPGDWIHHDSYVVVDVDGVPGLRRWRRGRVN
jgi:UDP-2,3-diacylglucosamine hydrolase